MEIQIVKELKELLDEYYGITVEWIIRNKSNYVDSKEESGNIRNFLKDFPTTGILGAKEEIYEIPNEGTVIYQIPTGTINLSHYVGIIKLLGFNEKESKVFLELKSNLEEVVKAKSGKELIDRFFPEHSKK